MFEKGIWGGKTQAIHWYDKVNNKYIWELYNLMEESNFLQYLDTNNLYGWALSQELPTNNFNWMSNGEKFAVENIAKLVKKNKYGYISKLMCITQRSCIIYTTRSLSW